MNIIPHIKKEIRLLFKSNLIYISTFIILPLVMTVIYGSMQKDLFEGKQEIEVIRAKFNYDENSEKGKVFKEILNSEGMEELIVDVDEDEKFIVDIDENFKDINIENKVSSKYSSEILKSFLQMVSNNMDQYKIVQDKIEGSNLTSEEKGKVFNSTMELMNREFSKESFETRILTGYKKIGAREYYNISLFTMAIMILIITVVNNFYKEKEEGIAKRIVSSPTNKVQYFISQLFSCFINTMFISVGYILISRVLGFGFQENLLVLILISFIQSILVSAFAGIIIAFVKEKKLVMVLSGSIIAIPLLFGGIFVPNDIAWGDIAIIGKFSPNTMILNAYKDFAMTGSIESIGSTLILMLILSIFIIGISLIKVSKKWEV